MDVKIYLTNLAKYNEGRLIGKWLDLPLAEEDLSEGLKRVLGCDEEYFITDFEAPFSIDEYDNLQELNEFVEELEKLDEYEQEKVFHLINTIGYSRDDALEKHEDVTFYPNMTLEEVTVELVEEGIFGNIADNIKCYIDYEKLARDLSMDGYYETEKGTFQYQ